MKTRWFSGDHSRLANICMAHRYLYYCKAQPVISDTEYDHLEAKAREEADESHPINTEIGSDWEGSYHPRIKALAKTITSENKANSGVRGGGSDE